MPDDGAVPPWLNFGDFDHGAVVLMPPGEQVKQITHGGYFQPLQPSR